MSHVSKTLDIFLTVEGKKVFNDSLQWWKVMEIHFPILARLVIIYQAVQPTLAPSECIFSVASGFSQPDVPA